MKKKFLALYFDAPSLAFGFESRHDRRGTAPFPTRSAVTGILCAASGVERGDEAFLAKMAALEMVALELPRVVEKWKDGKLGKARLSASNLLDYHTVGGGYDKSDEMKVPRKAETGKPEWKDGKWVSALSYREYLTDVKFGVIVGGDAATIEALAAKLADPVWGVWFGRKCCVPASPLMQGVYDDKASAARRLFDLCEIAELPKNETDDEAKNERYYRLTRDAKPGDEESQVVYDVPVTFERSRRGLGEEFKRRQVVVLTRNYDDRDAFDEDFGE